MQMVKIRISERPDRVKALETLTLRGRVVCLPENEFIVPDPAWKCSASWEFTTKNWGVEDSTMRKRRYEIHLPVKFNDGRPVSAELLEQTREELIGQFEQIEIYIVSYPVDIV